MMQTNASHSAAELNHSTLEELMCLAQRYRRTLSPADCWRKISQEVLSPDLPFEDHKQLFQTVYADWNIAELGPPPAWIPTEALVQTTHLAKLMQELAVGSCAELHAWSVANHEKFWELLLEKLDIRLKQPYDNIADFSRGIESPRWLVGAKINITDSCIRTEPEKTAVLFQERDGAIKRWSYQALEAMTHRVANGLVDRGYRCGDSIAICMPMTAESVAIYLGIIKAGCVVVSVADSFAPPEIKNRLRLAQAKGVFTQDYILRAGKRLPLYEKVRSATPGQTIVLPCRAGPDLELEQGDLCWDEFLSDNEQFESVSCHPHDHANILFSSGTTGDPKAIPWSHVTPIKCAADAWLHHNIQPGDVLAWPTNLGWMMGPWLIYASLINRACLALYGDAPTTRDFGRFVQDAQVTLLGVVPSLVRSWKATGCMQGLDWSRIKAFSSTGECSNAEEMFYLMALAGYKPVIEYCGGTEIGGGYITGTMVQPASPATFTTPAFGLDIVILDENGKTADHGEVFLVGPSLGLSTELLNQDHHTIYYSHAPPGPAGQKLRCHGDQMERLAGGYYRAHGRDDDTMNLGGIKVSSVEIEGILNKIEGIQETAAIAVSLEKEGESSLVIYAVLSPHTDLEENQLKPLFQTAIKECLNPLFKVEDVKVLPKLPRTASNKVMRRKLRAGYQETSCQK